MLLHGIADAMSDAPLVFTGQVATQVLVGMPSRATTLSGITMPVQKYNYQIRVQLIFLVLLGSGSYCNNWSSWSVIYRPPKDVVAKGNL